MISFTDKIPVQKNPTLIPSSRPSSLDPSSLFHLRVVHTLGTCPSCSTRRLRETWQEDVGTEKVGKRHISPTVLLGQGSFGKNSGEEKRVTPKPLKNQKTPVVGGSHGHHLRDCSGAGSRTGPQTLEGPKETVRRLQQRPHLPEIW